MQSTVYRLHIEHTLTGTFQTDREVKTESFQIPKTNKINPQYEEFVVPEGYKFLNARCWYPSFYFNINPPIPGFQNAVSMSIPPGDRDIQLYTDWYGNWMQVAATESWNGIGTLEQRRATDSLVELSVISG